MKKELLNLDLPDKYKEGIINYSLGIDNVPDLPTFLKHGRTRKEYLKLEQLVHIEDMKYSLAEDIKDNEFTEEEIKEIKQLIDKAIEEYNNME